MSVLVDGRPVDLAAPAIQHQLLKAVDGYAALVLALVAVEVLRLAVVAFVGDEVHAEFEPAFVTGLRPGLSLLMHD